MNHWYLNGKKEEKSLFLYSKKKLLYCIVESRMTQDTPQPHHIWKEKFSKRILTLILYLLFHSFSIFLFKQNAHALFIYEHAFLFVVSIKLTEIVCSFLLLVFVVHLTDCVLTTLYLHPSCLKNQNKSFHWVYLNHDLFCVCVFLPIFILTEKSIHFAIYFRSMLLCGLICSV